MERKKLGWIFSVDSLEGIPYLKCPYCNRVISGKTAIFAPERFDICPDCGKELHFNNVKEDDWLYISSFFGGDK